MKKFCHIAIYNKKNSDLIVIIPYTLKDNLIPTGMYMYRESKLNDIGHLTAEVIKSAKFSETIPKLEETGKKSIILDINKYNSYKKIVENYYLCGFDLEVNNEKDEYFLTGWRNEPNLKGFVDFKEDGYKIFIGNDLDKIDPEFLGKSIIEMFRKIEDYDKDLK